MSMMRCHCGRYVDTDFDTGFFDCCREPQDEGMCEQCREEAATEYEEECRLNDPRHQPRG